MDATQEKEFISALFEMAETSKPDAETLAEEDAARRLMQELAVEGEYNTPKGG